MDLLNQNYNNNKPPQKTAGTKIVITLLIICIIMAVVIVMLMIYIKSAQVPSLIVKINDAQVEVGQDFLINDNLGNEYISLKDLTEKIQYTYNNGEYQKYTEDKSKCYIDDGNKIVGFSVNSNEIYKTFEDSTVGYEHYTLKNNILTYQDKLYISLEDLQVALNVVYNRVTQNEIVINTTEYIATTQTEKLKEQQYKLTEEPKNLKAIAYNQLVVEKNSQCRVLNLDYQEIIGGKYKTMLFDEYNEQYIVSNDKGQYGIIGLDGNVTVPLQYDSLELINNNPVLYKVSQNENYGIMSKDGTLLTNLEYTSIGYPAQPQNNILETLIVPALEGQTGDMIVVCKDEKYGLVSMQNGRTVIECNELDAIYSIENLGEIEYKVAVNDTTFTLKEYIDQRNALAE